MKQIPLGSAGLTVSAQGLGCMGMSQSYGPADETESIATVHRALELGVTFLDTSDAYGPGHNEELLSRALAGRWDQVVLATKFAIVRDRDNPTPPPWEIRGDPEYVRQACDASLRRLGVDHIDLYYQHRVDPDVPIEDTIGAMADLVTAGKVRYLGVSEVNAELLERAHAVHPITAVQNEWSLWTRDTEAILPTLRRLGVGMVAYSPLGRAMLAGTVTSTDSLDDGDMRRRSPRFANGGIEANRWIADVISEVAEAKGATAAQVALAWVHSRGEDVVPIPGTKRRRWLEQNAAAYDVTLTDDDLVRLEPLAARVVGARY